MDKIFSARIDDGIYRKINDLSMKMGTSKKSIIEKAISMLAQRCEQDAAKDIFHETCGIWERKESPSEIVSQIKKEFSKSMMRRLP